MNIKRGDVRYINKGFYMGSEQAPGRPAVIVSNDKNNEFSPTVEVVYLTTQPKKDMPTHVALHSLDRESTALCEQVSTVSVEKVGDYMGRISDAEMLNIEIAMMISLDIRCNDGTKPHTEIKEVIKEVPVGNKELEAEVAQLRTERNMLQAMYDNLLSKMIATR